jgi:hypothetical protein
MRTQCEMVSVVDAMQMEGRLHIRVCRYPCPALTTSPLMHSLEVCCVCLPTTLLPNILNFDSIINTVHVDIDIVWYSYS